MTRMRQKSAFIVSSGAHLILPEMKPLSNANLLSKQSMGEWGKGKSCPHFALFGKTRGSNKGCRHKVGLQLIFLCWEVGLILGWSRGPAGCLSLSLPPLHTSQIITYLDFTLTAFLPQVKKSPSVWVMVRGQGEAEQGWTMGEINTPSFPHM